MRESIMLDSHIHLDADQYADVAALIKRARDVGVNGVVATGITPASNRRVLELARAYPDFVLSPRSDFIRSASTSPTMTWRRRSRWSKTHREQICAIGEVGLPWYGELARREDVLERARKILARFAQLATELDLAANPSLPTSDRRRGP